MICKSLTKLNLQNISGEKKTKKYFEGWYYKHTSANQEISFSIIPGVSLDAEDKHAFIQVIIEPKYKSYYVRYSFNDFAYSDTPFFVKIGKSKFSLEGIWLDIDNKK